MRSFLATTLLAAALGAVGCATSVAADPYPPDLVYVSPGVQVIADYNEPIFYSDGYYWRNSGGVWYRSYRYTGGWAYASPPVAVMRIDRPHAYVHYRPSGWVGHGRPVGPAPAPGWRGNATTPPSGWRGGPTAVAPQRVAPAPRPAYPPPAAARRAPPPPPPAAHPQPAPRSGGWR